MYLEYTLTSKEIIEKSYLDDLVNDNLENVIYFVNENVVHQLCNFLATTFSTTSSRVLRFNKQVSPLLFVEGEARN